MEGHHPRITRDVRICGQDRVNSGDKEGYPGLNEECTEKYDPGRE